MRILIFCKNHKQGKDFLELATPNYSYSKIITRLDEFVGFRITDYLILGLSPEIENYLELQNRSLDQYISMVNGLFSEEVKEIIWSVTTNDKFQITTCPVKDSNKIFKDLTKRPDIANAELTSFAGFYEKFIKPVIDENEG